MQNDAYKAKYDALNTNTVFNKKFETGFAEKYDGDLIDLVNNEKGTMIFSPDRTWKGATHVHNNDWTIEQNGVIIQNKTVKIHSPTDIQQFLALASMTRLNNESIQEVYIDVLASTGNYTLKFAGTKEDINNIPSTIKIDSEANNRMYRGLVGRLGFNKIELILLTFLEELALNDLISLYKIEKDENGEYTPKQVTKNTDGTIEYKDC